MTILVDHNVEGQALLLWGTLLASGWLEIVSIRLVTFEESGLSYESSDRAVWRFAQAHGMALLTDNRSMSGPDSLERTLREESIPQSFPVITIGRVDRLDERVYRERCVARLVDIALDVPLGAGRVYIP